jgi:hydroxypyruvate isomerase
MLKINPLIDLFFTDLPFEQRVPKIAECGYSCIETWKGGDATELKSMADAGKTCGVELISIVMNFATDENVAPIGKENKLAFLEQMDRYSDNALAAGCKQGIVTTGQSIGGRSYQEQRSALVEALRTAGEMAAKKGFKLNLEPLNTEVNHPGYFLDCPKESVAIIKEVGLANVKILFDVYHMEIMTGNQTVFIENNIEWIGHFHSAGVPGRHELFNGETNYPFILNAIEKTSYDGYFGLEYMPLLESGESLRKTLDYLSNDK